MQQQAVVNNNRKTHTGSSNRTTPTPASTLRKRQPVAVLVGIVLCNLLEIWLDHGNNFGFPAWHIFYIANNPISIDGFLVLTCAIILITFYLAALYGAWIGFVVGGAGVFIADLITHNTADLWYWNVGLALAGLIVGLTLSSASRSLDSTRNIGRIIRIGVIAIFLYNAIGSLGQMVGYHVAFGDIVVLFLAYSVLDSVFSLTILAILLAIYNSSI